ncbi:MAG: tyrosine recombinase [Chloroflexi bacterium]|nr:tyrosine recombinase [Chloroflexota bacterium]|tara:strand:- start:4131 stop:5081 length:951 start_codon:yes stop_codon:yes gene_type:complete
MDKYYFTSISSEYLNEMTHVRGLSEVTIRGYSQDLNTLFKFLIQDSIDEFSDFNRMSVRRYLSWLDNSDYSRSSIVRKLSVLRNFFRWLHSKDYIKIDPVPLRVPMKKPKLLPKVLSENEIDRLVSAVISYNTDLKNNNIFTARDIAILELIYGSGLRVSELAALNVDDIDFEDLKTRVIGKGNKERIVLFGEIAKNCLLDYMSIYRPKMLKDFDSSQNALFLSTRGTRLSVRSIQHRIKNYAKYAGLSSWVHPHTLRHSFATHMMDGGADIRVVQELLGHSSPATTQIYTHVTGAQAVKTYMAAHPAAGIDEEEK